MPEAGFTRADLYSSGLRVNACRRCDGCQRSGLRGRTPTALVRTLILSYYKGKIDFSLCLSVELTQMLYVPWVGQRHSFFCGKANASGPAYFRHLEGPLPAGGEFVEPCSVQDPRQPGAPYCARTVDDSA